MDTFQRGKYLRYSLLMLVQFGGNIAKKCVCNKIPVVKYYTKRYYFVVVYIFLLFLQRFFFSITVRLPQSKQNYGNIIIQSNFWSFIFILDGIEIYRLSLILILFQRLAFLLLSALLIVQYRLFWLENFFLAVEYHILKRNLLVGNMY